MRIGIVVPGFHAAAGEPFVPYWGDLVKRLAARHEVTVFALSRVEAPYDFHGAQVVPVAAGTGPAPRSWFLAARAIAARAAADRIDVLHSLHANQAGAVTALAAARCRRPCLAHVGGGELAALPDIGYGARTIPAERLAVALCLALTTAVTAGSLAMATLAARHPLVSRRRIPVWRIPFGVDTGRFAPVESAGEAVLVHVGDMNPVKDQETLVIAVAQLAGRLERLELHWVGDGPRCAALRSLARRLGVESAIHWWGRVPHTAVHAAYSRAAAFVASSRHEAQGVALCEAAACGLPTASTGVGVAPELPSGAVHLARQRDPAGLAGAILGALATGADDRLALRDGVARRFGIEAVDRRLDRAYRLAAAPGR
jgi:glycosyltransferase involved in cell wall biosynthesis